ncbi:MAG: FAD-binding oxidoreductase, partial [Betaproteobacteria bacterium]
LCVSCKGCKRECPTGVDMARMKIEYLAQYRARHAPSLRERLIAWLPRYAPLAARLAPLANLGTSLARGRLGFSTRRALPRWRSDVFSATAAPDADVVLFVDTFTRYFEPENARAAIKVLEAAGYKVHATEGLCCGRTFLSAGLVEQARTEARRMAMALQPFVARGVPVVGLEPSCLFSLRDEFTAMLPGAETDALARQAVLLEEFLAAEADAGRLQLRLKPLAEEALLHGHCHQKAFGAMGAAERALRLIPELKMSVIESSCCGMAGSFGYEAEHYDVSMKMAEANLLPAVRSAPPEVLIIADGTSCRQQIAHGTGREALHVARVLERALAD